MNTVLFIVIWIAILFFLISLLPALVYWISLIFSWLKPEKKLKHDMHYSIKNLKLHKGFVK